MSSFATSSDGGLAALIARLTSAGNGEHQLGLHKVAADGCTDLVRLQFQDGKDPYGAAWLPTVAGNTPPLTETGAMSESVINAVTGSGFTISITDYKAIFHQGGTRRANGEQHIPARPMLPKDSMPALWSEVIEQDGKVYLHKFIMGAA